MLLACLFVNTLAQTLDYRDRIRPGGTKFIRHNGGFARFNAAEQPFEHLSKARSARSVKLWMILN